MDECTWSVFVERYQQLLVGGLGFGGIILTLWFNAWMERRRHERQLRHERTALRTAFVEELRIIDRGFDEGRISSEPDADRYQDVLIPTKTLTDVYDSKQSDLGLLSRDEVQKVMRAYLLVKEVPFRVGLIAHQTSESGDYVVVDVERYDVLKGIHEVALTEIRAAIDALERALARDAG